jgi:hypothetical protein
MTKIGLYMVSTEAIFSDFQSIIELLDTKPWIQSPNGIIPVRDTKLSDLPNFT